MIYNNDMKLVTGIMPRGSIGEEPNWDFNENVLQSFICIDLISCQAFIYIYMDRIVNQKLISLFTRGLTKAISGKLCVWFCAHL